MLQPRKTEKYTQYSRALVIWAGYPPLVGTALEKEELRSVETLTPTPIYKSTQRNFQQD